MICELNLTLAQWFLLHADWPSFWQPAFAPESLGFLSFNHQVPAKFLCLEPVQQNELAHS